MKITNIALDGEENPAEITVVLTADEAAFVARLTGSMSPHAVVAALGKDPRWFNANCEVSFGLSGVFNRFYESGVNDVIPKWKREETNP